MLEQILKDMFVDPELLAELDDEQKQVLFFKMREEQIRRWTEREESDKHLIKRKNSEGKLCVSFLMDANEETWTWVMGDHPDDHSIETILQLEALEKARILAEKEAEELRIRQEEQINKALEKIDENPSEAASIECEKLLVAIDEPDIQSHEDDAKDEKPRSVKEKIKIWRQNSLKSIETRKKRRSEEIYLTLNNAQKNKEIEAEIEDEKTDEDWKQQEKKAKREEYSRMSLVKKVRKSAPDENMNSTLLRTAKKIPELAQSVSNISDSTEKLHVSNTPKIYVTKRPDQRPSNRKDIVNWFKEEELIKRMPYQQSSDEIAPWFHGIISRQDAEDLLEEEKVGSFLIRVSERIWGYAVTCRSEIRCKHFLISTSDNTYQFFGPNQINHPSLHALIAFYEKHSITAAGNEKLLYPCGQKCNPPDYSELM